MHPLLLFIYITQLSEVLCDLIDESCPRSIEFNNLGDFYKYRHDHNLKENEALYRVWLTKAYNENGAKCLDGSMPAFYYRPGYGSGINKFQLFFEGGGW